MYWYVLVCTSMYCYVLVCTHLSFQDFKIVVSLDLYQVKPNCSRSENPVFENGLHEVGFYGKFDFNPFTDPEFFFKSAPGSQCTVI